MAYHEGTFWVSGLELRKLNQAVDRGDTYNSVWWDVNFEDVSAVEEPSSQILRLRPNILMFVQSISVQFINSRFLG